MPDSIDHPSLYTVAEVLDTIDEVLRVLGSLGQWRLEPWEFEPIVDDHIDALHSGAEGARRVISAYLAVAEALVRDGAARTGTEIGSYVEMVRAALHVLAATQHVDPEAEDPRETWTPTGMAPLGTREMPLMLSEPSGYREYVSRVVKSPEVAQHAITDPVRALGILMRGFHAIFLAWGTDVCDGHREDWDEGSDLDDLDRDELIEKARGDLHRLAALVATWAGIVLGLPRTRAN